MDTHRLSQTVQPLLGWFQTHARALPWRADREPYHVWLSEIMLQQTRVEAVRGYYARFLAAAPDVFALAALPEAQLLKLWEGLGYYNRARKAQACAQEIAARGCAARATAGTSSHTSSGRCAATRSSARPCRRATVGPRRTSCARRSRCRRRSGSLWTQNNKKPPLSCSTGAALHLLAAQRQKSSFRSRYCGGRGYCMRRK